MDRFVIMFSCIRRPRPRVDKAVLHDEYLSMINCFENQNSCLEWRLMRLMVNVDVVDFLRSDILPATVVILQIAYTFRLDESLDLDTMLCLVDLYKLLMTQYSRELSKPNRDARAIGAAASAYCNNLAIIRNLKEQFGRMSGPQ